MSLFQCTKCGVRENTALANYWSQKEGKELCSQCNPDIGKWHDEFPRMMLPKGMFVTNKHGNLEHIENGDEQVSIYEIK